VQESQEREEAGGWLFLIITVFGDEIRREREGGRKEG